MQYLFYILAFIPYTLCGPITVQKGVLSYVCRTATNKAITVPLAETRASVQSSCGIKGKKITEFPKKFKPGFNQEMSARSATGEYYISPVNPTKYPNVYAVTSDGCDLAAVMIAGSRGLVDSQAATSLGVTSPGVVNRPGISVRTRPGAPVPHSVRTFRPVVGRSESSSGNLEKRAIDGSSVRSCTPKTYDWNSDISGTGRQVGNIPVPGSRAPF